MLLSSVGIARRGAVRQRLASYPIYWVMLALAVLVSAPLIVLYLYQGYEKLARQEGARLLSQGRVIRQNLVYQLESTDRVLQLVRARRLGFADVPLSSHDLIMLSGGTQGATPCMSSMRTESSGSPARTHCLARTWARIRSSSGFAAPIILPSSISPPRSASQMPACI